MSKENAKNFYQKFVMDKELQRKVAEAGKDPKQNFVDVAKEAGFDFTIKDFEDFMANLTIAEAAKLTESNIVTKGKCCYCFAGGGGNPGGGGKTCACVAGGGGIDENGDTRCVCIAIGSGS